VLISGLMRISVRSRNKSVNIWSNENISKEILTLLFLLLTDILIRSDINTIIPTPY
jgi:hypothetical protein